jgi:hypothetical protein
MSRIIVVTSGKGGVGKTTTSASFAAGLALRGHKTAVIDFDVGLRNLDLIMGCERRVVYDLINVIHGEAGLNQALIKDKQCDNLFVLAASQTRDKDALTLEGVERVLEIKLTPEARERFLNTRTAALAGSELTSRFNWQIDQKIPLEGTIFPNKSGSNTWTFDLVGVMRGDADTHQPFEGEMIFRYDYFDEGRLRDHGTHSGGDFAGHRRTSSGAAS